MDKKILAVIGAGVVMAAIIAVFAVDIQEDQPQIQSGRHEKLGLVINTPNVPTTLDELNHSYERASSTGIGRSNVYVFWNVIEPERGEYNFKETDILMSFNKKHNQKVTLFFSLLNGKTLGPFPNWIGKPSLSSISDDKVVSVLDAILSRYDIIDTVVIAGETDEYFRHNELDIPVYKNLFTRIYDKLKDKHPSVKIGNAYSLHGVLNKELSHIIQELEVGDFVAFSYMPVNSLNDVIKTPSEARSDLEKVFELSPNKNVGFFEISWTTSNFVNGSNTSQREFIDDAFDFFDDNKSKIEFFTWYRLYDRPEGTCEVEPEQVEGAVSVGGGGGIGGSEFVIKRLGNYICSAGLLDVNDNPKPAWNEFQGKVKSIS